YENRFALLPARHRSIFVYRHFVSSISQAIDAQDRSTTHKQPAGQIGASAVVGASGAASSDDAVNGHSRAAAAGRCGEGEEGEGGSFKEDGRVSKEARRGRVALRPIRA